MPKTNEYAGPEAKSIKPALNRVRAKFKEIVEYPTMKAAKKRAFGKENPTDKEMQDKAYGEASRRWPWLKDEE